MKKFLCLGITLLAITISNMALAKQKCIKFCAFPYAPFVIIDKNNKPASGFDIDLTKALCQEMGAKCKFIMQPKRSLLLPHLNSGRCDAWLAAFTISPGRRSLVDFTQPYYASSASFIAAKNTKFTSINKDLKNKKIAVTAGSNFVPYLEVTNGFDIEMIEFINDYEALAALNRNEVDAVISDAPVLRHWMNKQNKDFRIIDLPPYNQEFSLGRGYGIPVKKGNSKLLNALNKALTKIKASGKYDELVMKYFKTIPTLE